MTNPDLDSKLEEIKKYAKEKHLKVLIKRIYDLNLPDSYIQKISNEERQFIHVKLHAALSYKKPFASLDKIKEVHDRLAKLLTKHPIIDELDA
ncbi:MAG: hypothetical protein GY861_17520 [bacterium]|nr:hypothetical protein [bacterium]